jgi:hypothetical protein
VSKRELSPQVAQSAVGQMESPVAAVRLCLRRFVVSIAVVFASKLKSGSAFTADLNATATTATVVTHLTGFPQIQSDPVFRNGFEN